MQVINTDILEKQIVEWWFKVALEKSRNTIYIIMSTKLIDKNDKTSAKISQKSYTFDTSRS